MRSGHCGHPLEQWLGLSLSPMYQDMPRAASKPYGLARRAVVHMYSACVDIPLVRLVELST